METYRQTYYPTILKGIHLVILYIFIQTVVDFPLALIDYYKDTEYLYNPVKKVVLGVGSVLFILIYGIKKSKEPILEIFPFKLFNPLVILPVISFLWGAHNYLDLVNAWVARVLPPPPWFWELFNRIFEGDYGLMGVFLKVAVVAPVVEELIFRGLIFNGFRKNYNGFVAVLMSALLFSLFHLNPWQMPATFVLGLLLGWLMLRTNNILVAILGHSINNSLVLLAVTYQEQLHEHSIYLLEKPKLLAFSGFVMGLSLILIYFTSIPWRRKNREKS